MMINVVRIDWDLTSQNLHSVKELRTRVLNHTLVWNLDGYSSLLVSIVKSNQEKLAHNIDTTGVLSSDIQESVCRQKFYSCSDVFFSNLMAGAKLTLLPNFNL